MQFLLHKTEYHIVAVKRPMVRDHSKWDKENHRVQQKILGASALILAACLGSAGAEAHARHGGGCGGLASWYGPELRGRRTASGEAFQTGAFTAAHRFWPFGTRVRVTNTQNGRSVVVRINDRGPFARGRIIDLSRASAQAIGMRGVALVMLARL